MNIKESFNTTSNTTSLMFVRMLPILYVGVFVRSMRGMSVTISANEIALGVFLYFAVMMAMDYIRKR